MPTAIERNAPQPHFEIAEDSTLFKALSCIPVLGAIPSLIQQLSVNNTFHNMHLKPGSEDPRAIELIEVKNDYKKAGIINGLFSMTIAVLLLNSGLFSFGMMYAADNLYRLSKNNELIEQMQRTGLPLHFKIR